MAGNTAYIEVDDKQVRAALDRIIAFGTAAILEFYRDVGEEMLIRTRARAAREEDPQGIPWVPLSPRYKRYKDRKRPGVPKLKFDSHMLSDMLSYQATAAELLWGTNAEWGATHQFGDPDRGIPARPWLGLSGDDASAIVDIALEHLQDAVAGR
jgi:phage virion morphogenesis protein